MKITVEKAPDIPGRGHEIVLTPEAGAQVTGSWPTFSTEPNAERLLVPDARRLRDQLDKAIKEAERLNSPQKKIGDY